MQDSTTTREMMEKISEEYEKAKNEKTEGEARRPRLPRLEKGMKLNIGGVVYKVTAVRPNGKATIRPVGVLTS